MGWKQNLAYRILSMPFAQELKQEPSRVLARLLCYTPQNLLRIRSLNSSASINLNLGAGQHEVPGWQSIDLFSTRGSVIRWDLRWGIPLKNGLVRRIHCEHFLEHLNYPHESSQFLRECFRVLEEGGELRIIVPDAARYIRAYVNKDEKFFDSLRDLGGASTPFSTELEIMNQAFRMGGDHHFAYDEKTLSLHLQKAGFTYIVVGTHEPDIYVDQSDPWRLVESLYLTAKKHLPEVELKLVNSENR